METFFIYEVDEGRPSKIDLEIKQKSFILKDSSSLQEELEKIDWGNKKQEWIITKCSPESLIRRMCLPPNTEFSYLDLYDFSKLSWEMYHENWKD